MNRKYEAKHVVLGGAEDLKKEVKILNRTVRWESGSISLEADQKHVEQYSTSFAEINRLLEGEVEAESAMRAEMQSILEEVKARSSPGSGRGRECPSPGPLANPRSTRPYTADWICFQRLTRTLFFAN